MKWQKLARAPVGSKMDREAYAAINTGNYTDAKALFFGGKTLVSCPKKSKLIQYEHYTLANGLQVILHQVPDRPLVVTSVLYKVGSRNDPPGRTGFAHLFEHLMFAGSENVNNFDDHLHQAGGENNAFTTSDYTLYYDIVPATNLETALWLESDRMKALSFSEKALATEQKVVVEEFKETCIEEPYGDVLHHLYALAYREHPYRWPVIGESFEDIASAELPEVEKFFYQYYRPNNAILSVCGNFKVAKTKEQIEQWFSDINPSEQPLETNFPVESPVLEPRIKVVTGDVATPAVYFAFPVPERLHPDFYALDVLVFLLGGGRSSRLYRKLVRENETFHHIEAGLTESFDPGLLVIEGRVSEEVEPAVAIKELLHVIDTIRKEGISERELQKVINKLEIRNQYGDISLTNLGSELCIYAAMGDIEMINQDVENYRNITIADIERVIDTYLDVNKRIELLYLPEEE